MAGLLGGTDGEGNGPTVYGHRADGSRRGETAGQYGIGGICPKGPGGQGHKALDNGERMCDARPVRLEAERSVPGTGSGDGALDGPGTRSSPAAFATAGRSSSSRAIHRVSSSAP